MIAELPVAGLVAVFIAATAVITLTGIQITGLADRIADRTGWGEAVVGGAVLGAATSTSGTVVSVTAALGGDPSLAFSNGVGGIAAQTVFLAFADVTWRRANLEHAAAETANLFQAALLLILLGLVAMAVAGPDLSIWAIHPVSVLLVLLYVIGLRATARVREAPMWKPVNTVETREDTPDDDPKDRSLAYLASWFAGAVVVLGLAGWVLSQAGAGMIARFGLSSSLVGALFTAVATSMPELVTTLAAVRRGALQLAVGGIIGGNVFDTLFLSLSDFAYREGSIYHAVGMDDLFWLAVGVLMTAILLSGLILREKQGPGSIGWESLGLIAVYVTALGLQVLG